MSICELAPEVLYEVFNMAIHRSDRELRTAKHESPRTAVALSHTCSFWRQVCLAYPDLWTFLPVDDMSGELLRLFVQRSAPRLLSLYFERKELYDSHRLYDGLLQRAKRVHARRVTSVVLSGTFPQLEELVIEQRWSKRPQNILNITIPSLKQLHLIGFIMPSVTPLPHLTELQLVGASDEESKPVLPLLSAMPRLKVLRLDLGQLADFSLQNDDIRRFLSVVSLPEATGCCLKIIPRWLSNRPTPNAIMDLIPTSAYPLPLTRGAQTMVFVAFRQGRTLDLEIRNYRDSANESPALYSSIHIFLGPFERWSTSGIIRLLDAFLLHPDSGINNYVTVLNMPDELIGLPHSHLPRDMLTTRFPRLEQFSYEFEQQTYDMEGLVDALLKIAPLSLLQDFAEQQQPVRRIDVCPRTFGFDRLNITGLEVHADDSELSALLDNTALMHGLSGVTVMFNMCHIVAADEQELESMFQTRLVGAFNVTVLIDKCEGRIGALKDWVRLGAAGPCRAGILAMSS